MTVMSRPKQQIPLNPEITDQIGRVHPLNYKPCGEIRMRLYLSTRLHAMRVVRGVRVRCDVL